MSNHNSNNTYNQQSSTLLLATAITVSLISFCAGVVCVSLVKQQQRYNKNSTKKQRRRWWQEDDTSYNSLQLKEEDEVLIEEDDGDDSAVNNRCIYLDYNGTTPIYKDVMNVMIPYLTKQFGNPSSSHYYGIQPKNAINQARKQILSMLGIKVQAGVNDDDKEQLLLRSILFTGCGTESDNLAIHLAIQYYHYHDSTKKNSSNSIPHIVTCSVEHPAIIECLNMYQQKQLCDVSYVPVQSDGRVLASDMIAAIRPNQTVLVTLMLANNESGALQPVKEVAEYCHAHDILCHIDAAQAVGKVSMNITNDLGNPDMITIVGHKIGAPKGIACLYIRPGCFTTSEQQPIVLKGLLLGGGQEYGIRAGTENVPYIVALGKACELCTLYWKKNQSHMEHMRNLLLLQLEQLLGSKDTIRVNGPIEAEFRLPNTLSIGIKGIQSGELLLSIRNQVAASAGAACHSSAGSSTNNNTSNISSVLRAMNVPEEFARGTIRLSVGPGTTKEEIIQAASIIGKAAKKQLGIL